MTWWSEYSAAPRFVLAKLAIRCRFVDRFVGSRAPSHVSGQRFSTRDASLPCAGSRRARFPVVIGTIGATTSRPRKPGPLCFRFQAPRAPPVFVFAKALPVSSEEAHWAWNTCSAGVPCPACCAVGARGISQVSWRSIPSLCPAPRPRPSRQDLAANGHADTAPGRTKPKASAGT